MGRIVKWLFYLGVVAGVGLVGYAYVGPFLGADFSPQQTEIRTPVTLNVD